MRIEVLSNDDFYSEPIRTLLSTAFPGSIQGDNKILLEVLSKELIGSKQCRLGPIPDPETQVSIREIISESILNEKPIPILIPWGASKQGPFNLDIADVMAMKQIECLQQRISKHYKPGIYFVIRLEDLTDIILFDNTRTEKIHDYCLALQRLTSIIQIPFLQVSLESTMMKKNDFLYLTEELSTILFQAINSKEDIRKKLLHDIEWTGCLPAEQIEYYQRVYSKFYPYLSVDEQNMKISKYFAQSLAKKKLNGTALVGGITLSFTPPIPGVSTLRKLFYRTIPEKYTNCHKPPWIGKGYIKISGRDAYPGIAGWDGDGLKYNPLKIKIINEPFNVVVDCDYVIEK